MPSSHSSSSSILPLPQIRRQLSVQLAACPEIALSHCSPHWACCTPSPQRASQTQPSAQRLYPPTSTPSSHSSSPLVKPSPQLGPGWQYSLQTPYSPVLPAVPRSHASYSSCSSPSPQRGPNWQ